MVVRDDLQDSVLYDDAPDLSETSQLELKDGLIDWEIEDASRIAPLTKGVMIVTGAPRSGKDLFGNWLSWKIKRYFKDKRILRDERPRRLFGSYIPFNPLMLQQDLARMKEVANGKGTYNDKVSQLDNMAKEWMTFKGEVLLKNAVLYLTEFGGYMYNREPFNPMNRLLGRILRMWGHLDLLVIGTTQQKHELDRYTCIPFITHEVRCKWSLKYRNTGLYNIYPQRYITTTGALEMSSKTISLSIDGGKSRPELDGKRYFDLFNSKSAPQISPKLKIED